MKWILEHLLNIVCALFAAILGYFKPINGIIDLMISAIVIDFIIGIWVSLRIGKKIQSKLMWRTIEKLLVCILLVTLSYSAYHELGMFSLHIYVAWGVVGFEFWSILENLSKINNIRLFKVLKKITEASFEKKTGVKIDD